MWTDALEEGFWPSRYEAHLGFRFTAAITLEPHGKGTKYTATVMHSDETNCKKHEDMGFLEGWGTVLEQFVPYVKSVRT